MITFEEYMQSNEAFKKYKNLRTDLKVFLMNYFSAEVEHMLESYQSFSTIFIKGLNGTHIIFDNNTFDSNVGLHGGVAHIDLQPQGHFSHLN